MQESYIRPIELNSSAFKHGDMMPEECGLLGGNVPPDLQWHDSGADVESYVLMVEDPDIPVPGFIMPSWVHWLVYDIAAETTSIPGGRPDTGASGNRLKTGLNSFGKRAYSGPCPPFGAHRYFFKVYALDTKLELPPSKANRKSVLEAMAGHVVGSGELVGKYKRPKWYRL